MASKTGRIAPPGYPTVAFVRIQCFLQILRALVLQICFTSLLSIISWKISPPVLPMNDSSISGVRGLTRGCTWLESFVASVGRPFEGDSLGALGNCQSNQSLANCGVCILSIRMRYGGGSLTSDSGGRLLGCLDGGACWCSQSSLLASRSRLRQRLHGPACLTSTEHVGGGGQGRIVGEENDGRRVGCRDYSRKETSVLFDNGQCSVKNDASQ